MIAKEIRTPQLNLLLCKVVITEEENLVLELKNGKRVEQLPLDVFLTEINDFAKRYAPKLHNDVE